MVSSNSYFCHKKIKGALWALLIVVFCSFSSYPLDASAITPAGTWEVVPDAIVVQGETYSVRRKGFYSLNTISISGNPELTDQLRLVVISSTHDVSNADGNTADNQPYFNLSSVNGTTRINFSKKRARLNYSAELQQFVPLIDTDGDGIPDETDICPIDPDNDVDGDGVCGEIDICPLDADNDIDGDGVCGDIDICPLDPSNDIDGDGVCGEIDICPLDADNDIDGDGVCGDVDSCPNEAGSNPDGCNVILLCPLDDPNCITITGLISGNGAQIDGASIKVGTNSVDTTSELDGSFTADVGETELANDGIDDFFPVQVAADGFASGYAKVVLVPGTTSYEVALNLQQVSDTITEDDDITQGVELIKDGAPVGELTIPEAALPAGVTGVTGAITYLDPETDDILSTPGGDLLALPEGADPNEDSPVQLETFGMMEFDLVDQNGDPITELGGDAEVCMRAPSGLELGDIIPLWYYDEEDGLWKEEGEGTVVDRDGQLMICGAVTHFSWWNYDQPIATHSCMRFEILPEGATGDLDGLTWYSEGVTYNGASPRRVCSDDGGVSNFESFTVKVSTVSNTEQIRVYTTIGGSKFYLLADGDNTYSLTQSSALAAVFNTPIVQGSCLSNTLSGDCINLDHGTDDNGVIPLSADINFPPVITEFTVADHTLLVGESMEVMATVTDPEGFNVNLDWNVDCGYYGNSNGDESMTPMSQIGGLSGGTFTSTMTAPSSLSYFVEYCQVSLTATDSVGLTTTADRWVTVAGNYEYQVQGIVYGTDGSPLQNASVYYDNYSCDSQSQSTTTDENGMYFLEIDTSQCSDDNEYYYFYDLGYLYIDFVVDGLNWSAEFYISNDGYYEEGGPGVICEVLPEGETLCQLDINLPTLWGPLSGKVHQQVGASNEYLNLYTYGNGFSDLYLNSPLPIAPDSTYGPIMVPIGQGNIDYRHTLNAGTPDERTEYNYSYYTMNSLEGTVADVAGDGVEVFSSALVTVFDGGNPATPVENAEVNLNGNSYNGAGSVSLSGLTDPNGQFMPSSLPQLPLGYMNVNALSGTYYFNRQVQVEGEAIMIDLGSSDQCEVKGTIFDEFGVGKENATYEWNIYQGNNNNFGSFTTDENGEFSFLVSPGQLDIYSVDFYNYRYLAIDNCRPIGGEPRVIRFDTSHFNNFFYGEF
jgi:hypothetical protein